MPESPSNVYTIGVIADTHNRWKPRIEEYFADVDEIWHLGDVCREEILDQLRGLCPQLHVVLGNNDFGIDYPLSRTLERNGEVFRLIHIPPRRMPPPGECDWLLHGHTHVPRDETVDGVRVFNPGSAGLANKGAPTSLGFLRSVDGGPFTTEVRLIN
ncbi:MAG: metallophosphoesterase family protein [Verrucomicrobiota bacterium]